MEALSPRSLNQPLERMRGFRDIQWHLLPGNHDPHRPNGLWDQLLRRGLPENVNVHTVPGPAVLQDEAAVLLPAPLFHRRTLDDLTAYMEDAVSPEGLHRSGWLTAPSGDLAPDDQRRSQFHRSRPAKPRRALLPRVGDWHGQKQINERCWYSGTPETDAFDVIDGGQALLVEIEGPGAAPTVTPIPTGSFTWSRLSEQAQWPRGHRLPRREAAAQR